MQRTPGLSAEPTGTRGSHVRRALYIIAGIESHVYKHRTADVACTRGHAWLNTDWPRYRDDIV